MAMMAMTTSSSIKVNPRRLMVQDSCRIWFTHEQNMPCGQFPSTAALSPIWGMPEASSLSVTEDTVKARLKTLFMKLKVHDRTEAAITAIRHGIVHLDNPPSRVATT
jgi:hypothetical protein